MKRSCNYNLHIDNCNEGFLWDRNPCWFVILYNRPIYYLNHWKKSGKDGSDSEVLNQATVSHRVSVGFTGQERNHPIRGTFDKKSTQKKHRHYVGNITRNPQDAPSRLMRIKWLWDMAKIRIPSLSCIKRFVSSMGPRRLISNAQQQSPYIMLTSQVLLDLLTETKQHRHLISVVSPAICQTLVQV